MKTSCTTPGMLTKCFRTASTEYRVHEESSPCSTLTEEWLNLTDQACVWNARLQRGTNYYRFYESNTKQLNRNVEIILDVCKVQLIHDKYRVKPRVLPNPLQLLSTQMGLQT
ncbi:unnamed protein product [Ixodes pacificus]